MEAPMRLGPQWDGGAGERAVPGQCRCKWGPIAPPITLQMATSVHYREQANSSIKVRGLMYKHLCKSRPSFPRCRHQLLSSTQDQAGFPQATCRFLGPGLASLRPWLRQERRLE
ncbi:hypothetical protein MDA_GLEAN10005541 [Myotis davidii]|uniref:Uncharacterized protein n=1 Tax=Myotis davidii TaxID=225400 RepID=L5M3B9_MYODS|nr:hypothetical protein MDA_GLEAN10005541 [Myotis davidii]